MNLPMRNLVAATLILGLGGPLGCNKQKSVELAGPVPTLIARQALDVGDYVGISAIGEIQPNQYILIPERQGVAIPITLVGEKAEVGTAVSIADAQEFESVAFLPDGSMALGTEAQNDRKIDHILIYQKDENGWQPKDSWPFDYGAFGIEADRNHGLEGLCAVDQWVLAGSEVIIEVGEKRQAPLGLRDENGNWSYYKLNLTSSTGKVSSLACQWETPGQSLRVYALERHYEVSRILTFTLPLAANQGPSALDATVIADLSQWENLPNLEGLHRREDGKFILVSDNHTGSKKGESEFFLIEPTTP